MLHQLLNESVEQTADGELTVVPPGTFMTLASITRPLGRRLLFTFVVSVQGSHAIKAIGKYTLLGAFVFAFAGFFIGESAPCLFGRLQTWGRQLVLCMVSALA